MLHFHAEVTAHCGKSDGDMQQGTKPQTAHMQFRPGSITHLSGTDSIYIRSIKMAIWMNRVHY